MYVWIFFETKQDFLKYVSLLFGSQPHVKSFHFEVWLQSNSSVCNMIFVTLKMKSNPLKAYAIGRKKKTFPSFPAKIQPQWHLEFSQNSICIVHHKLFYKHRQFFLLTSDYTACFTVYKEDVDDKYNVAEFVVPRYFRGNLTLLKNVTLDAQSQSSLQRKVS